MVPLQILTTCCAIFQTNKSIKLYWLILPQLSWCSVVCWFFPPRLLIGKLFVFLYKKLKVTLKTDKEVPLFTTVGISTKITFFTALLELTVKMQTVSLLVGKTLIYNFRVLFKLYIKRTGSLLFVKIQVCFSPKMFFIVLSHLDGNRFWFPP